MNSPVEIQPLPPLNLLLFSVGGVVFGIDTDQVAGISAYESEDDADLVWFHEELGYGDKGVSYQSPTVVTIRCKAAVPYRVIIDSMEDIAEFSQADICGFPPLIEPFALRKGIWGVLLRGERMVILLDFMILLRERGFKPTELK